MLRTYKKGCFGGRGRQATRGKIQVMKHIVVGVDFSDISTHVLDVASTVAKGMGAELSLVHIYAPEPAFVGYAVYSYPGEDERQHELQQEKAKLRKMVDDLKADGIEASAYMEEGETVDRLMEFVRERNADLIVAGTHGRSALSRVLLGSVAEGVVRASKVPVLVVPAPDLRT